MPEIVTPDARLHVEVDGSGEPVTVLAHGLTNSCRELAAFTPAVAGSKVRFCFRGHGHSSAPETGYGFAELAGDLRAVADAYDATRAVGTSLGAGAICRVVAEEPDRFERLVLLLPAALDIAFEHADGVLRIAEILETHAKDEAVEMILSDGDRAQKYEEAPWLRDFDVMLWQDMNPIGVARAIRGIVGDRALEDREVLRKVEAPTMIICREGDLIHPAELGRILADLFPRSELIVLGSEGELLASIPMLVEKVAGFLS